MNDRETQNRRIREIWAAITRCTSGSAPEPCPDPEILSAYTAQLLSESEKALWETHFSVCAACQETLVTLAEAEENAPLSPAIPLTASAAAAPPKATLPRAISMPEDSLRRSRWRTSWHWLAPAMTAVVVLAVWLGLQERHRERTSAPTSPVQIAKNTPLVSRDMHDQKRLEQKGDDKEADASTGSTSVVSPNRPDSRILTGESEVVQSRKASRSIGSRKAYPQGFPVPQSSAGETVAEPGEAGTHATNEAPAYANSAPKPATPPPSAPQTAPVLELRNKNDAQGAFGHSDEQRRKHKQDMPAQPSQQDQHAVASITQSTAAVQSSGQVQQDKLENNRKVQTMSESVQVVAASPQDARVLHQPATSKNSMMLAKQQISTKIFAPGNQTLWIVGPAGAIQHSTNGGISLVTQTSGVLADLLAGSAPSPTVCWVVGRAGTVLLTTDGEHWTNVGAPGDQDWVGVRSSDALHAVIWDKDQHATFSTANGGKTWTRVP
ncbi:MAG TPA: hypothetical protein VOA41_05485 [Candidatus Dormibacteraeota bacterium]|nr:hypothetical protein [Candidatus Dormibacteraeota bacterium]